MLVNRWRITTAASWRNMRPSPCGRSSSPATDQTNGRGASRPWCRRKGTAPKAALEHYTVAGKTGTAQKAGPGGYLPGKYFSSFIGFFPADNPELCISIVLDEPKEGYYGGQVCGPIFKEIAERANYLNIPPDEDAPNPASPPAARALPGEPRNRRSRGTP